MSEKEKTETAVDEKPDPLAGPANITPHPPQNPPNPSKEALVLAFREVFHASTILAELITSGDSKGSTTKSPALSLTTANCSH